MHDIYLFAKNKRGRFLFCNENFAAIAGLDSPEQIKNKTDYDMCWQHLAPLFQEGDHRTLQGESFQNVHEFLCGYNREIHVLVNKEKLVGTSGKVIGIVGTSIDITKKFLVENSGYYEEKSGRFYLGDSFNYNYLTKKEYQIFKYILYGNTAKIISSKINLSRRTVEDHITSIKAKLNCSSKNEIISVAHQHGFLHMLLPKEI